jgi:hypothetical protein
VKIVEHNDHDYKNLKEKLEHYKATSFFAEVENLNLENCEAALSSLTEDASLSRLISSDNSAGYTIWKDAVSPQGVSVDNLVTFAVGEVRILKLEEFVSETFSTFVLRERQDTKVRYEVNDENLRISSIFASIEENKSKLQLADYCVSQTSLEQVFNMHAAEAERQKSGRIEQVPPSKDIDRVATESDLKSFDELNIP